MNDTSAEPTPRIWLVIGDKPGDNAQVEIIAEALGLPYEVRRVLPRPEYVLGKPRFKASLYHLDLQRSDPLEPPWPDVILTIGRRPSMAALWIQEQSGGHSRIVLLGRPKRWMERFSLIVVPSQYRMPEDERVLHLDFPLMRSNAAAIEEAAGAWRERLADLPRPLTAVFIGGQTKPFRFDAETARHLLDSVRATAGDGFLYLSTSRRTPPAVIETLKAQLPANGRLYCWTPDNTDNPYLGLLGLADRFVVTGDSMSMMIEVARLGKPLAIYALPYQKGLAGRLQLLLGNWLHGGAAPSGVNRLLLPLARALYRLGLVRYSRDLTAVHRLLYEKRLAAPLEQGFSAPGGQPADELQRVVGRVRAVVESSAR